MRAALPLPIPTRLTLTRTRESKLRLNSVLLSTSITAFQFFPQRVRTNERTSERMNGGASTNEERRIREFQIYILYIYIASRGSIEISWDIKVRRIVNILITIVFVNFCSIRVFLLGEGFRRWLVGEALVRGKRRIGDDRGLGRGGGLIDDEPWIFGCARFCGIERREMKYLSRSG